MMTIDEISRSLSIVKREIEILEKYSHPKYGVIYGLYEVGNSETLHYVGATLNKMERRFYAHKQAALHNRPQEVCQWIRGVWERKGEVAYKILLEHVEGKDLWRRETDFIRVLSKICPP